MNKIVTIGVLSAISAMASTAASAQNGSRSAEVDLAGYNIVADRRQGYVSHVGRPMPEVMGLNAGSSAGVPMGVALRLVAPPGWRIALADEIDTDQNVSWNSGTTWVEALEAVGKQTGSASTIHWERKLIALESLPDVARLSLSSEILDAKLEGDAAAAALQSVTAAKAADMVAAEEASIQARIADEEADRLAAALSAIQVAVDEGRLPPQTDRPDLPSDTYTGIDPVRAAEIKDKAALIALTEAGLIGAPVVNIEAPRMKPAAYPNLSMFLNEQIQVDIAGATFEAAIQAALPPGWTVDMRADRSKMVGILVDMTVVDSRGAVLNAVGREHQMTLIPFVEFGKVIVTSKD